MLLSFNVGDVIRLSEILNRIPEEMMDYIGDKAIIKGKKILKNNIMVLLIEFKNYARIWVFIKELN
uniref:Uncharacterized protein n=1 Tax=Cyanidium caldarium TaxID=2771 RepID=O19919_CYACA|nr:hypothetical protein JXY51_pgp130 [Cyanidium caldarium]AAB82670.1 unknown [Cyanidium caldarium]WDB00218.1 hypothetical protein CDCA019_096 [Cyanidium caldarium]